MKCHSTLAIGLFGVSVFASTGLAQVLQGQMAPLDDRWMYPFNTTPGTRFTASNFGTILLPGFDDYDAQFLIGFDTTGLVPPGLGVQRYHIESVVLRIAVSNDQEFRFDPTVDSFESYLDPADPSFVIDADAGRPIELFGTAYRGEFALGVPFDALNWTETEAFGNDPVIPPAQGSRFVYNAVFDLGGSPIDVSSRISVGFDVEPFAVGVIQGVAVGDLVPADSVVSLAVNPCLGGADAFLRRSLDQGVLRLTVASLHDAAGGPGGPIGDFTFPVYYTRENPLAQTLGFVPTLELRIRIGSPADLTGSVDPNSPDFGVPDGTVDANDFFFYLGLFADGDRRADLSGSANAANPAYGQPDCTIDANDFFFFLDIFIQG